MKAAGVLIRVAMLAFTFGVTPLIICDLWRWFVVPLGVAALSHWQAFGLGCLWGVFNLSNQVKLHMLMDKDSFENFCIVLMASELLLWLFGYLAS